MGLRVRLWLIVGVLLLGVAAVLATALWGISAQTRGVDDSLQAYRTLSWSVDVGERVDRAAALARDGSRETRSAVNVALWEAEQGIYQADDFLVSAIIAPLSRIAVELDDAQGDPGRTRAQAEALDAVAEQLDNVGVATRQRVTQLQRTWEADRKRATDGLFTVAGVVVLISLLVCWSQYTSIMEAIRRFNDRLARIAGGKVHERLRESRDGELGQIAGSINRLAERQGRLFNELEARVRGQSAELARAERLASVGFLAAGVAHEINNPLAVIAGEAELLDHALADAKGDTREGLAVIRDEAFKCKKITERLLALAKPGGGETEPVDLKATAEQVARNARVLADERSVVLTCDVPEPITVLAENTEVQQVLLNLIVNAIEADAETVHVSAVQAPRRHGLAVSDDGRGLEPEQLTRVFEPFFTTKTGQPGTGGGTGLGLALAYAIVERTGGLLEAFSDGPFQGCTFRMTWPKEPTR